MSDSSDPSHWLLGIAPTEQPPDHYRLLGIERLELNSDVIANAAQRQLDHLKRCSSGGDRQRANFLCQEVTRARDCLLDRESHRLYAAQLQGVDSQPADLAAKADWRAFVAEFDQAWRAAQALTFDPQHHWLGIPLHQRPASNLRLLGLSDRERGADVIRGAAERQISFVRKFASGEQSEAANDLLRQLSRARAALLRSIRPDEKDHAEVQANSQASVPVPRGPVFDRAPPVVEPDLADLDASHWEVPVPVTPQPSVPVAADATQFQPKWIVAVVASAVIGVTLVGLTLSVAGYISYSRRSVRQATPVPGATDPLDARFGQEQSNARQTAPETDSRFSADIQQTSSADPAMMDLDEIKSADTKRQSAGAVEMRRYQENSEIRIENEQTLAAFEKLAALQVQMHGVQARMSSETTTDEDHQKMFELIEELGKLATEFPRRRSTVDARAESMRSSATRILEQLHDLRRGPADEERQARNSAQQESMTVVESESANPRTETIDQETQPSSRRPLFFSQARDWTPKQGTPFSAIASELRESGVYFERQDGVKVWMTHEQLIPSDANVLRLAYFGLQDEDQLEQSKTSIRQLKRDPAVLAETLKGTHLSFPHSPYAGLWASVWMSEGDNRHQEATSMLRNVVKRIERQRETDPSRHAMTLTSALNNLAVCSVKDHQIDRAASYLVESLETTPTPPSVVLHNARQLKEFSEQPGTPLAIRSSSRRNLDRALKNHSVDQESLPSGWYYSMDVDLPRYGVASNSGDTRHLSQDSEAASAFSSLRIRDTWCINCKGLGSVPCKYGKCNNGKIVVQRQVQVAVNPLNGEPVYGNKGFKQSCPSCSGRGRFDCPHCEGGRL